MSHTNKGLFKVYVAFIPSRCLSLVEYYTHSRMLINSIGCESEYTSYPKECLIFFIIMSAMEPISDKVVVLRCSCWIRTFSKLSVYLTKRRTPPRTVNSKMSEKFNNIFNSFSLFSIVNNHNKYRFFMGYLAHFSA